MGSLEPSRPSFFFLQAKKKLGRLGSRLVHGNIGMAIVRGNRIKQQYMRIHEYNSVSNGVMVICLPAGLPEFSALPGSPSPPHPPPGEAPLN